MKHIAAILAALSLAACSPAPPAPEASPHEEAILKAVDDFFIALGKPDAAMMDDLIMPGAITVIAAPEKGEVQTIGTVALLPKAGEPFRKIRERYWDPVVLERGGLAVVWAPYIIHIDDEFSHCGVDVFNLSSRDGAWKIDTVSFTREPSGCDALGYADDLVTRPDFSVLDAKE